MEQLNYMPAMHKKEDWHDEVNALMSQATVIEVDELQHTEDSSKSYWKYIVQVGLGHEHQKRWCWESRGQKMILLILR